MPQPNKGPRHVITTKLKMEDAEKLAAVVRATGKTRTEIVAGLVHDYLETVDLDQIAGQEAFPIEKAS